ncbi:MAG TPA: putative DNA-binding domain-containing protein [Myxococcota bacterium]|nr:putative DNA-binding domain-containing protein [Myxococcota bacterium]
MLAELQRAFARELFAGGERLAIHRDNVLSALAEALAAAYPVCVRLVGEEFFRALARRFAREVPSRSPDLCDYGAELGDFIAGFEPARALPYLADVARLEWRLHLARHAAVSPAVDFAGWAELPDERRADVRLRLAPATALLGSPFPIDRIHETNQPGFAGDARVSLDGAGARLVIAREPEGAACTRLGPAEWSMLAGLARGQTLAQAAAGWDGSAEALARLLARAAERRWLGGLA